MMCRSEQQDLGNKVDSISSILDLLLIRRYSGVAVRAQAASKP
jgi:hypothetical protein